jgi:hypothetical protein
VIPALLLAGALAACGGSLGPPGPSSSGSSSTSADTAVAAAGQQLCQDLLLMQSGFRPDALTRLLPKLKADATAFASAGDPRDALTVHKLVMAVKKLRKALIQQQGVTAASNKVQALIGRLPSC